MFSPDEGMAAPPEGDIAALAAKVQRSSGGAGGKKKASKKSQELQESLVRDGSFAPPAPSFLTFSFTLFNHKQHIRLNIFFPSPHSTPLLQFSFWSEGVTSFNLG